MLIVGWIDDSDSGITTDDERSMLKETLIQLIDYITEIYSLANESGILDMRFMNRGEGKRNWKEKSEKYLNEHRYGGMAHIGRKLREEVLDKCGIGNSGQSKPLLVLVIASNTVCLSPNISEAI